MNSLRTRSARALLVLAVAGAAALLFHLLRRRGKSALRAPLPDPHRPVAQAATTANPAGADLGTPGRNTEERLDEALEETFPGSDPISTHIE